MAVVNGVIVDIGVGTYATLTEHSAPTVSFLGKDGIEIIKLEINGDIYVNGKLIENDKQVVDAMRTWLTSHGQY